MKARSWQPMLKSGSARFTFTWKLFKKKIGREVSIFVLTIRNLSLYSEKTTYSNIDRMSLNLLTRSPKKRTEMQIICIGVDGSKVQL